MAPGRADALCSAGAQAPMNAMVTGGFALLASVFPGLGSSRKFGGGRSARIVLRLLRRKPLVVIDRPGRTLICQVGGSTPVFAKRTQFSFSLRCRADALQAWIVAAPANDPTKSRAKGPSRQPRTTRWGRKRSWTSARKVRPSFRAGLCRMDRSFDLLT